MFDFYPGLPHVLNIIIVLYLNTLECSFPRSYLTWSENFPWLVAADPVEIEGAEEGGVGPDWSLLTEEWHFALRVKEVFHLRERERGEGGGRKSGRRAGQGGGRKEEGETLTCVE